MRLFTAIEWPEDVRDRLVEAQGKLKETLTGRISWTLPRNLHLTLKFLGEVAESEVMRVCDALRAITLPAFSVQVTQLGVLPPRGRARVLMAEVGGQLDALAALNEAIESACEPLGFAREKRRYHPHITLARFRVPRKGSREIEEVKLPASEPFKVSEFVLMQSILSSAGSQYQRVASLPLG